MHSIKEATKYRTTRANGHLTHLGETTRSNVKTISGGLESGEAAFPTSTTVSPLRTFLTRAVPWLGSTGRMGAAATGRLVMVVDGCVLNFVSEK